MFLVKVMEHVSLLDWEEVNYENLQINVHNININILKRQLLT